MTNDANRPTPPARPNEGQPGNRRNWSDYVEEQINEARERGDFDNLQGTGKRLQLEKNVFAGDRALAYSLLKNNAMAPPEIERAKEIDAELERAEMVTRTLRHRRDTLLTRRGTLFASDRRAYNLVRDKTETRYRELLRAINSNILSLNITAPPAMHRRMLDVEARMNAFQTEFPRMEE